MIDASDTRQVVANTLDLAGSGVYENTIHENLGIRILEATPDKVILEMDVGPPVHQPFGLLHGGASATIAESAASIGAYLSCDYENGEYSVGVDLNITHLRARRDGKVVATATPVRRGRTTHVWGIELVDENGDAVAIARCTLAIRSAKEA